MKTLGFAAKGIDSQPMKTAEGGGVRSLDAGKRLLCVKGGAIVTVTADESAPEG